MSFRPPRSIPISRRAPALRAGQHRCSPYSQKGFVAGSLRAKKPSIIRQTGETGVKKLSTSSVHAWIPAIFMQHSTKLAAGKHLRTETSLGAIFTLWCVQTSSKMCLFIEKITLLSLLCTPCPYFAGNVLVRVHLFMEREQAFQGKEKKRTANWEKAFPVSTTILIALAVSLSNK